MPDYTPTATEVKDLLAHRVAGQPFSDTTTPTKAQVDRMAGSAAEEVEAAAGPVGFYEQALAKRAATLLAASDVERAFWPEQQDDSGVADQLYARYESSLEKLRTAVARSRQRTVRMLVVPPPLEDRPVA